VPWELVDLSNGVGSLGSQSSRSIPISYSLNFLISLLQDLQVEHSDVSTNNAATNRASLPDTSALGSVSLGSLAKQNSDSAIDQNSLVHRETISVDAPSNLENISLEWLAQNTAIELSSDPLVIKLPTSPKNHYFCGSRLLKNASKPSNLEKIRLGLVVNVDGLLFPVFRVSNVELFWLKSSQKLKILSFPEGIFLRFFCKSKQAFIRIQNVWWQLNIKKTRES
jgi:hypothetical protein